jgi:molybdopterin/thiamine biosynthesis adenylyltransferase
MFGFDLSAPFIQDAADTDSTPEWELVLTAAVVRRLRETLLKPDEIERTAFVRCFRSGSRLLAAEVEPIPDTDMVRQGRTECRPELDVERRAIHETVDMGGVVFHVHSHPFADTAGFSGADRRIMPKLARWVDQTYQDEGKILFGVLGRRNLRVTEYNRGTEEFTPVPVSVLGSWALETPLYGATPFAAAEPITETDTTEIADRFDRNLRAFGADGQLRLREAEITVVGVGGLGSSIAEQLARIGVGTIHLVDPDHLEETNLPRVYGAYDPDVGTPKVDALRLHLTRIDPELTVTAHETVIEAEAVSDTIMDSDAIVAGLDRMSSRSFLNQFCVRHGIPYVDAGVAIGTEAGSEEDDDHTELAVSSMDGFVQTIVPGVTACFDCLDRIDPAQARLERLPEEDLETELNEGYIEGTDLAPEPAVVTLNTTVAGMAVSELVNFLTGVRAPRGFLHYEAVNQSVSLLDGHSSRDADCRTCGTDRLLFRGDAAVDAAIELDEGVDTDLDSIPTPPEPDVTAPDASGESGDSDSRTTDTETEAGDSADEDESPDVDRGTSHGCDDGSPPTTALEQLEEVLPWKR